VELSQLAFHLAQTWRNPVLVFGDYYLAHTMGSVAVDRREFGPLPAADWALDGSTGGSGGAKIVSPLGTHKRRDGEGYNLADHYRACAETTARMTSEVAPLVETGFLDDAELVAVSFGTPAKYVRAAVRTMREDGLP